jgi:hypothetical protein
MSRLPLPRVFVRVVGRLAEAAKVDEARVVDILLGAPAPTRDVEAIAGALRTLRDQDPTDPDVLLLAGIEPRCVGGSAPVPPPRRPTPKRVRAAA